MNIAPKKISLTLLVLLATLSIFAAPPVGPPPPTPPPPPGLPIDGSVGLLIFVAIVYGFYTLRKFKLESK
ncbi:MAG: hypothetical protein ABI549_08120 [Flavobacterium sp.]|uniref:PID-CTERM protein-sorting domain-containing protein n=1 Tax=Flavobacterium sp. TaxID=239 RepID=UPI003267E6C2